MTNPIPYGRQHITEEDISEVIQVLKADYLTQGPKIAEFERNFARYVGSKYAVAVANGTAALHLCAMAQGVKKGTKVITTPITFAASANCIAYCGGEIELVDIDPDTYLLDIGQVKKLLSEAPEGTYSGIIPVDFAGRAVDLEKFRALADEYGLWMIEDACHAPGGFFEDSQNQTQRCGNGDFAEMSIFSLHPVKHIAAGEGGVITTNDKKCYEQILELRTHGITRQQDKFVNSVAMAHGTGDHGDQYPGWYMEMQELGYNYRLTDIQAALANSQLQRADQGLMRRREIAKRYYEAFSSMPQVTDRNVEAPLLTAHAYHLYVVEVKDRLGLYNYLRKNKVYPQIHYIPLHYMPYYQRKKQSWQLPNAEAYYAHCLSLPMYPTLREDEQDHVIELIRNFYR